MFSASAEIVGPVFYSRQLSDKAKLLYGLIWAMTKPPKYYAFAHNETFARFLGCSERSVQRYLDELVTAGEITILDSQGGRKTVRKIQAARLCPFNHDTDVAVNHDTDVAVTNNSISNNKSLRINKRREAAKSQTEIIEWLDLWAARLEADADTTIKLIQDLHSFAEMRVNKGKPLLTIRAASLLTNRLIGLSKGHEPHIQAMRYMLQACITNNWQSVVPIEGHWLEDFQRFLVQEGVTTEETPAEVSEGWN